MRRMRLSLVCYAEAREHGDHFRRFPIKFGLIQRTSSFRIDQLLGSDLLLRPVRFRMRVPNNKHGRHSRADRPSPQPRTQNPLTYKRTGGIGEKGRSACVFCFIKGTEHFVAEAFAEHVRVQADQATVEEAAHQASLESLVARRILAARRTLPRRVTSAERTRRPKVVSW